MVATETPICQFGEPAPDFALPDPDGRLWTLAECSGQAGTLVIFMCNHCPYVKAVLGRIVRDARELQQHGVGSAAIMANDYRSYPADAPEHMRRLARERDFPFPYLVDETQAAARAYGAVCTPDFFGYDADLRLRYRGRLDASRREAAPADAPRDLFLAMVQIARTGEGPREQIASMGCSIKWRAAVT